MLDHFPPYDLAAELIELYFRHSNIHFPLLHRPTFDRQWNENLHHRNVWFISLCSAVFAVASKWCNDRRVLPPACKQEDGDFDWTGAGRQYFELALGEAMYFFYEIKFNAILRDPRCSTNFIPPSQSFRGTIFDRKQLTLITGERY